MPTAVIGPDGFEPALAYDEEGRCACGASWGPGEDTSELYAEEHDGAPRCPDCGEFGAIIRITRQPERWPVAIKAPGFVQLPHVFLRHHRLLGFSLSDVALASAFEMWPRPHPDAPTWVSNGTVAAELGMSEKAVRDHVRRWCRLGLYDRRERRENGRRRMELRRRGLNRALAHIAENLSKGRDAGDELESLLDELREAGERNRSGAANEIVRGSERNRPPRKRSEKEQLKKNPPYGGRETPSPDASDDGSGEGLRVEVLAGSPEIAR